MRSKFDAQLEQLNNNLVVMGALCESAIACAVKALLEDNEQLAAKSMETEKEIDQKEREIENLCLKLLLEQQPVAKDLRLISSALKMITDMERIGDQAADISEIATMLNNNITIDTSHIDKMANATIKMVTDSVDAFVHRDIKLAEEVIQYDDVVDELFTTIRGDLIQLIASDTTNGEEAIDILMIAKYLERIGDHATNIAEWVEFSIKGKHRH